MTKHTHTHQKKKQTKNKKKTKQKQQQQKKTKNKKQPNNKLTSVGKRGEKQAERQASTIQTKFCTLQSQYCLPDFSCAPLSYQFHTSFYK